MINYLKKHQLFSIYSICFFTIAIIPLILSSVIISISTSENLKSQIIETETANLKNIETNSITTYNNYSNLASKLAENYLNYSMFTYTSKNINYDLYYQFSKTQQTLSSTYPNVKSVYIYNENNHNFLVDNSYRDINSFYDTEWLELLKQDTSQYKWLFNRLDSFDTIYYPYNENANIIINVDIQGMYNELFSGISDNAFVIENGKILWKNNASVSDSINLTQDSVKLDGAKYLIVKHTISQNGRTLVILKNSKQILSPLKSVSAIVFVIVVIMIILTVLAGFYMANMLSMPVKRMISSMDYETDRSNELDIISEYISQLNKTNYVLKSKLSLHSSNALEANILKLLRNIPIDDGDFEYDDIFPSYIQNYTIATIQFGKESSTQDIQNYITDAKNILINLSEILAYYLFYIDNNNIVILLFSDNNSKEHDDSINTFINMITHIKNIRPIIAVSNTIHDPSKLHLEFTNNFELIKYRLYSDSYIIHDIEYSTSSTLDVSSYESALFKAINEQSYQKANSALVEIMNYIYENKPHPDIVLAYFSLLNTKLRNIPISIGFSNEELLFRDVYETSIPSEFNLKDYYNYFINYANNIIAGLNIKTTSKNNELINSIKAYILENIETDLSLSSVSEHYGMTPQYLSMMFKNETHQNFVKFLTQAKIDRSKELLANTSLPIKSIAEIIGYNERSFFTVFKKNTGMTPKEYRTQSEDSPN